MTSTTFPGTSAGTGAGVAAAGRPPITVRKPALTFDDVPRHWLAGLPIPTHMANGVNLLFPYGERFFVRSVYYFLDQITDPALREAIKGFGGQEGRHAKAHEDYFDTLRAQGYDLDRFLRFYQAVARRLERAATPEIRLATTAAAEHFTALMAEGAAGEVPLENAHPRLRALLYWHAAEELEHKAVAYDVLQAVDPRYSTRVIGLAIATSMLATMWWLSALWFLHQDGFGPRALIRQLRELRRLRPHEPVLTRVFARGIRDFLRRDFHPDQQDNYHLAAALLARAEAAGREAAGGAAAVEAA